MRKKAVNVILVAMMVLGLCACSNKSERWQEQYDLGMRYLSEHDYEEAVLAFSEAIEIDPKREEAFVGRGDANLALAEFRDAQRDYEDALELEQDIEIYLKLSNSLIAQGEIEEALEVLNDALDEVDDDGRLQDRIDAIENIGEINGAVYEWNQGLTDKPISDAIVTLLNEETSDVEMSFVTGSEGTYAGYALPGDYIFYIQAEDFLPASLQESVSENQLRQIENIFLIRPDGDGDGRLSGIVSNAATGEPLEGVSVWYEEDWKTEPSSDGIWDYTEDEPLLGCGEAPDMTSDGTRDYTDAEGMYSFRSVSPGYYTLFAEKEGFVTASVHVVAGWDQESDRQITLSPVLSDEELRIVLTWGDYPEDLDSHLVAGQDSFAAGFCTLSDVYYANMAINSGNADIRLDVDDTTSFGPETITIHNYIGQKFTYAVHDYTNKENSASNALSESGASVTLYNGSRVIGTFHVPANLQGNVWEVFSLDETGALTETGGIKSLQYDYSYDGSFYTISDENGEVLQRTVYEPSDDWSHDIYITYDGQGNVVKSEDTTGSETVIRDGNGNVVQRRVYSEYGYICYDAQGNILWERNG